MCAMNLIDARPAWPPAVIAGAYRTGILGVRSLARRGVNASMFDCDPQRPGFKSKHGPAYLCPDPDIDPDAWVDFMVRLAKTVGGKPALISSADQFVSAIAAHEAELANHYVLSSGTALQGALATKRTQYDLAARHGMPMPRTRLVRDELSVRDFAGSAQFPCVLKPLHFREWQRVPEDHPFYHLKVAIARNENELVECWRLASVVNATVIIQEMIEGPDSAKRVYLSCYSSDGRRIANAMFRELRCDPMGFGPATVTEPIVDEQADEVCDAFLRNIGYSGICEIEVKYDSRDGQVKLIEANPRLSGSGDAAPYDGVDLCWLHYLDLVGHRVEAVKPKGRNFRHLVLRSEVRAIANYRRAGVLSWPDLLKSYRPPLAFFDLDGRDLRYSVRTFLIMAREVLRQLFGWFA